MSVNRADRESLGSLSYRTMKDIETRRKAAESGKTETEVKELTEAEKKSAEEIAAYKKKFLSSVESMVGSPVLSNLEVRVKISDAGYQKMLNDPEYEAKVLDTFRKETLANYDNSPKTITLAADGERESVTTKAGTSASTSGASDLSAAQLRRGAGLEALNLKVMEVIQSRLGGTATAAELDQGDLVQGGTRAKGNNVLDAYRTRQGLLDFQA